VAVNSFKKIPGLYDYPTAFQRKALSQGTSLPRQNAYVQRCLHSITTHLRPCGEGVRRAGRVQPQPGVHHQRRVGRGQDREHEADLPLHGQRRHVHRLDRAAQHPQRQRRPRGLWQRQDGLQQQLESLCTTIFQAERSPDSMFCRASSQSSSSARTMCSWALVFASTCSKSLAWSSSPSASATTTCSTSWWPASVALNGVTEIKLQCKFKYNTKTNTSSTRPIPSTSTTSTRLGARRSTASTTGPCLPSSRRP